MARFDPQRLPIKEEEAARLLEKVLSAEDVLRKAHFDDWKKLLHAYQVGPVNDGEIPGLGLISATVQSAKPYIFHNDPSLYCKAKKATQGGDEEQRARVAQAALSYEWTEGGFGNEASKILDDALIFSAGVGRVTYQPTGVFVPVEDYDRDLDEEDGVEDDEAMKTVMDRLEELGLPADRPSAHATLLRVSPFNFVFPPGYDEIHRMPWVAVRHLVHIDEVKNDKRFANTKGLSADKVKSSDKHNDDRSFVWHKEDAEHVEIYEVWYHAWTKRIVRVGPSRKRRSIKEMRVLWVCNQSDDSASSPVVLKHTISPLDMEGYPFVDLRFERTPDQFYGISLAAQVYPVAEKIQRLVDGAVEGLEAGMALKTIYKDGIFDKTAKALLSSNRPAMVPAKSKNPGGDVRHLVTPAFPQEFHGVLNMLRGFMGEVGAGDEAIRGGRSSARSATEVAYRASALQGRSEMKLRVFEKFVERIARKTLQVMQQYFDARRWVSLTGIEEPFYYSRGDIRGEFDVGVHAGSMKPVGPEAERQSYIGFMNALAMAAQSLSAAQVPPQAIASFYDRALKLWEQDSPELRDSFAQFFEQAAGQAGQMQAQPAGGGGAVEEGAAVSPETGASLNIPLSGRLSQQAAEGAMPPGLV